jgi:hypothetical protein
MDCWLSYCGIGFRWLGFAHGKLFWLAYKQAVFFIASLMLVGIVTTLLSESPSGEDKGNKTSLLCEQLYGNHYTICGGALI